MNKIITENKLTSKERKDLPESIFGLPEDKSYPLVDEEHVRKAIQFFKYCKPSKKLTLSKNINKRAKQLDMSIGINKENPFYKYANKAIIKESNLDVTLESFFMLEIDYPEEEYIGKEGVKLFELIKYAPIINDETLINFEGKLETYYIPKMMDIFEKAAHNYSGNPLEFINKIMDNHYNNILSFNEYNIINVDTMLRKQARMVYSIIDDIIYTINQRVFNDVYDIDKYLDQLREIIDNFECNYFYISRKLVESVIHFKLTIKLIDFQCHLDHDNSVDNTGIDKSDSIMGVIEKIYNFMKSNISKMSSKTSSVYQLRQSVDTIINSGNLNLINTTNYLINLKNGLKEEIIAIKQSNALIFSDFDNRLSFFTNTPPEEIVVREIINSVDEKVCPLRLKSFYKGFSLELSGCDIRYLSSLKGLVKYVYPIHDCNMNAAFVGISNGNIYLLTKDINEPMTYYLIWLMKDKEHLDTGYLINKYNEPNDKRNVKFTKITRTPKDIPLSLLTEGITINEDGDIKFTLLPKKSYMDQYSEVHKMLVNNSKSKNYEGMKKNLAFLFAMITSIEREIIYKKDAKINPDKKVDAEKARTFAINDFKTYMKEIMNNEPRFDFTKYYEDNGYDKIIINIPRSTISGVKKLFKTIMSGI